MAELTFVNHASVIVADGPVRLLCDPWLEGTTFDQGWDLLARSQFTFDDFHSITHIWFSHEHPDHFFPPNLKRIPPEVRRKIVVLFQKTRDQKVLRFCAGLGFQTRELPPLTWETLAPGFRVCCGPVPFYDSWLLVEAGDKRILNLNDCQIDTERQARRLLQQIGSPLDVLLCQFSYASWLGNRADKPVRERAAAVVLNRLQTLAGVLKPAHVVPFASFIYFCHEENAYLNDSINTVETAARALEKQCIPVVLYPGDRWLVGESWDNAAALARWAEDYRAVPRELRSSPSVPLERLRELAVGCRERIRAKNNRFLLWCLTTLGIVPRVRLRLLDLGVTVAFDSRRGLQDSDEPPDVMLSSECLAFVLEHEWGMDTLHVNGRFETASGDSSRLLRAFAVSVLNNTGRRLSFALLLDRTFCRKALERLLRR